jgi:hypothetical protein
MIERFIARSRRFNENGKVFPCLPLTDKFGEPLRPQACLQRIVLAPLGRNQAVGR